MLQKKHPGWASLVATVLSVLSPSCSGRVSISLQLLSPRTCPHPHRIPRASVLKGTLGPTGLWALSEQGARLPCSRLLPSSWPYQAGRTYSVNKWMDGCMDGCMDELPTLYRGICQMAIQHWTSPVTRSSWHHPPHIRPHLVMKGSSYIGPKMAFTGLLNLQGTTWFFFYLTALLGWAASAPPKN